MNSLPVLPSGTKRLRPLFALGTTLSVLCAALESDVLGCAVYPALTMVMLLVLVAELQRLLDGLPLVAEGDLAEWPEALGIESRDRHTGPSGGDNGEATADGDTPGS
ncbi:MAG: hypothetical protein K2Y37_10405 [Pirellulales bacterium]|nr:hypothetical protein [Pirellulales bacterium]